MSFKGDHKPRQIVIQQYLPPLSIKKASYNGSKYVLVFNNGNLIHIYETDMNSFVEQLKENHVEG